LPTPAGHDEDHYAWKSLFNIQTPKGYSILISHPHNRFDLPFTTLSGIVDSDMTMARGNLPFFLKSGFEGIIPVGTPIYQVMPFKRENWQSEHDKSITDIAIKNEFDTTKIPFYELIRNCEATLKVSAKFSNWNKDGGYYYNSFAADEDLAISTLNSFIDPVTQYNSRAIIYSIAKNNKQHQFDFNSNLAENNKFPFSINSDRLAHFSLNFDARLVAEYFKKIAIEERGIFYIDDEIISFEENSNKEIVKINCKSNAVHSDFVFDCSGFKRLLIGKYYNSEWKSYSEHLPADKAFPFFLSHEQMGKGVTSHINAVAMKYGWMWQIHLKMFGLKTVSLLGYLQLSLNR